MKRFLVVVAVVAGTALVGVVAYGVLGPDPAKQAQADGCGRSRTEEFNRHSPGWAYVGDKDVPASSPPPPPQWLSGRVQAYRNLPDAAHPSGGDDPTTHDSFDFNFNVLPDAGSEQLLGGMPEQDTGNFEGSGEEKDRIHPERESKYFPTWAWPEVGDHVQVLGSWVWDCGHWDPGGERTEIHPYRALWDERTPSPRSPYGESEGALFVSTDATPAGQIAECAHKTKKDPDAFKACTFTQPNWLDVSGDYTLRLAAPPKPAAARTLAVRVVDHGSTVDPHWTQTIANGVLTLRFHLQATPNVRLIVAKQVFLGWRPSRAAALPRHLRVTFTRLLTRRAMDPGCPPSQKSCASVETKLGDQITSGAGEWLVYTDVAGSWSLWPRVLPGKDGRTFKVSYSTDIYVRSNQSWRLFVFTHECDFGVASWSDPTKPMAPCPKTAREFGNFGGDDVPGEIVVQYRGDRAVGPHAADGSLAPPSTCPASNTRGCYRLWWNITRIRGEAARAARYG
ncbi:MAG: hypothetical protein ABI990_03575 [Actinomycetota bacterium]